MVILLCAGDDLVPDCAAWGVTVPAEKEAIPGG